MQQITVSSHQGNMDDSSKVDQPEVSSNYMENLSERGAFSISNDLTSPGLRSTISAESEGKETYRTFGNRNSTEKEIVSAPTVDHKEALQPTQERRGKPWLFLIIGAIACLIVGLAVGLGVGLTRKSSAASALPAGPAASTHDLSTIGAFNGSGIALASESFGTDARGRITMYFQHHTGQIRQTQLGTDGWIGGDDTTIVASDAKNATPISAVSYTLNDTANWHIFYINTNNTVHERVYSNTTNYWAPGPLNKLNLQAMDDPNVGLQGCWYGSFYSVNSSDQTVGIHLWYAKNSTTFGAFGWTAGDAAWTQQPDFHGYNGHAGVACFSWGGGSDTYVMFVNLQNELNILWKDLNSSLVSTAAHPINVWKNTSISIPVFQNTSLGYTNFLYAQNPNLTVSGYNISYNAENSSITSQDTFVINEAKGIPGTHLTCTTLPDASGGDELVAFFQTNGTNIEEFTRDLDAGQWAVLDVPIPNL